jgi:hypothetical protein
MFLFAFLIQSVDPITNADRKATAAEHMTTVEERLEVVDRKQLALDNRRNIRRLKAHIQHQRMDMIWRESMSRRTRNALRKAGSIEVPMLLKSIGVPVEKLNMIKSSWMDRFTGKLLLPEHSSDGGKSIDHGLIDIAPGDGLGK